MVHLAETPEWFFLLLLFCGFLLPKAVIIPYANELSFLLSFWLAGWKNGWALYALEYFVNISEYTREGNKRTPTPVRAARRAFILFAWEGFRALRLQQE